MDVAVLNPQDCLQSPLTHRKPLVCPPPRAKTSRNANCNSNRGNRGQPGRKKRSPNTSPPPRAAGVGPQAAPKNMVMGQVRILKRGEELAKPAVGEAQKNKEIGKIADLDLGSTERLGPVPEKASTEIRLAAKRGVNGFYAGSAFVTSPPPSSLPLPAFFIKKCAGFQQDDASSDLRRILGISL